MHYSGEVENICTALWQIYSGKYVQNLSESAGFYRWSDNNIRVCFSIYSSNNCCSLTICKC